MIDTDKYEGHTEGPWRIVCWERKWYIEGNYEEGQEDCTASEVCRLYGTAQRKDPTARLIADAPLLLQALIDERAEVKRLREQVGNLSDKVGLLERAEATWYSMVADELDGDYND